MPKSTKANKTTAINPLDQEYPVKADRAPLTSYVTNDGKVITGLKDRIKGDTFSATITGCTYIRKIEGVDIQYYGIRVQPVDLPYYTIIGYRDVQELLDKQIDKILKIHDVPVFKSTANSRINAAVSLGVIKFQISQYKGRDYLKPIK